MTTTRTGICAALILFTPVPAQATDLPVQGGSGGSPFRAECPSGQFLVGVSIKSGSWVDAIYPLCAPFVADQGTLGQWTRGPRQGGGGGAALLKDAVCPSDRVVWGIKFGWTRTEYLYVDYVELICMPISRGSHTNNVCVHTGDGCWDKNPNPPPATFGGLNIIGDEPFRQNCDPKREVATGFHGRSGTYVDALGLICGPDPVSGVTQQVAQPANQQMMENIDLLGSDFRSLVARNAGVCSQACSVDEECRAWTFVRQGSKCFLKSAVPAAVRSDCCISGVKDKPFKDKPPKTKEECEAKGYLWVPQKDRCYTPVLQNALRVACEQKGHRYDPQTTQCGERPSDAGGGGAQKTCAVKKPVDICPAADGCGEGTGVEPIGTLEAVGTVTVFSVQGPWHEVKAPGGRQGFVYSADDYPSLDCR